MKRKLTLTVEESVVRAGKELARRQGTSLSQLVEQRLREAEEAAQPSVARKWRGRFKAAAAEDDPRMEYLEEHYR